MKSTTFIAILLTILMLLLVAVAAVFFLWQDQQNFESERQMQQAELNSQEQMNIDLQNTAVAREMAASTNEARVATLEAQLVQASDQLATRQAELDEARAVTPIASPISGIGPPPLQILYPTTGAILTAGGSLPVIVIASAEEGISSIDVQLGDRPPVQETYDDNRTFAIFDRSLLNLPEGTLQLTATMTTTLGNVEDATLSIVVR